jgi:hypothetical protein
VTDLDHPVGSVYVRRTDQEGAQPDGAGVLAKVRRAVFGNQELSLVGLLVILGGLAWLLEVPAAVSDLFGPDPPPMPPAEASVELGPPTVAEVGGGKIHFAADRSDYIGPDGFGFVVPGPIEKVGRPPTNDPSGWRRWAYSMGGMDGPATTVRMVIVRKARTPVAIVDLKPKVKPRAALRNAIRVKGRVSGCGITENELYVPLDKLGGGVESGAGQGPPYELQGSGQEFFDIVALARRRTYEWVLEVVLATGKGRKRITIKDGTQPFRTAALGDAPEYAWEPVDRTDESSRHRWVRSGPPC